MDLKTLTELRGPSGWENAVRKQIIAWAQPLSDEVTIDRAGNVICKKKGTAHTGKSVLFAAHMDEVGFIVVGYTDDGLLRFRPIGGIDPRVVVSKWVQVGEDALPGVIGAMAIHMQSPEDRKRVLDYTGLFIDIGAKDQKDAEKLAPLGTYATFDTSYEEFGDGFVCAKALDDRVGCYNLLRLLEGTYEHDLTVCFVSQEEVGLRGSQAAAFSQQPDTAVVFEGTAANDLGDVDEQFHVCVPGKGVAVSFMDGASIAHRDLFKQMLSLASEGDIPCQVKQGVTGGNDAGSFQLTGAGARTVVLSVPCRYIHSGASVAQLSDIDAQLHLAQAFIHNL